MAVDHNNPQSRTEEILIATIDGNEYNKLPQSRLEELLLELKQVIEAGGGGGGTTNYNQLSNKPQINGFTLSGEMSAADLSLVLAEVGKGLSTNDYSDEEKAKVADLITSIEGILTGSELDSFGDVETALADKVNKVNGKGLSTNDFTDEYKAAIGSNTTAITAIKDGTDLDSFGDVEVALLDKADTSDLGTAAAKDSTNSVTAGSTDLVESGAVKDAIDAAVASAYHHAGTKTVAQLTHDLLIAANEGNVYNITDSGTTTSDFIEGIGKQIDAGDNVGICKVGNVYMFDLLSGFVDTTNFVQKSQTSGLLKNDGTVNTTIEDTVAGHTTAIDGKQDTLTFDDTPTDGSNNPVKSNGIYDALATKQNATDNSLDTDAKTIVGAINEHEGDVESLKSGFTNASSAIEELQAYTGYSTTDIIGIEVDYVNKSFRRLGAAVGKDGGSDFDAFPMFGGRRRCNVADDGTISKYYGDTGYAEDGSNGQVMVYQPKFYYKVVPLKLEKQSTGKGYHIRKAAYYVTATPMKGFKVHPAFVNANGNEVDYILVGASKGCIYDVSENKYILDDAQVMDNTADKFSSIFGVKPASGLSQDLTRPKIEQMCKNRGANWHELNVQMASMTQLLMLVEYGKFDMQRAIGKGVVDITDNSSYNCGATSGSTSALGNASGRATSTTIVTDTSTTYTDDGKTSVTYRGEEDPYGDMWEFVMGMNIYGNGSMNGGELYICSDYNYAESKNTDNYKGAGFTIANSDGYVNAFGYGSEDFDWLFIASEVGGSDALPVGDYLRKTANLNGYRIAMLGAVWAHSWGAGAFGWSLTDGVGYRLRHIAGRLAYIPA